MPKIENRRRRRKKNGFLLGFFVVVFLGFVLLLTSNLFFKVKEITAEGCDVVSKGEVIALSGFSQGDNILLINKTAAARSIISSLPYVKAVRVKRDLPGRVVIVVTEAQPTARAVHRDSHWLFDAYGSLLESVAEGAREDLPLIKGFSLTDPVAGTRLYTDEETKIEPMLDLLRAMSGIIHEVGEIDLSMLSNITFTYRDRYSVELGPPEGFQRKIERLLMAFENDSVSGAGAGTFKFGDTESKTVRFIPG